MTLEEARELIGRSVVYRPSRWHGEGAPRAEDGVITSVNNVYVMVRYGSDQTAKATAPSVLELQVTP